MPTWHNEYMKTFGERLRSIRELRGMKSNELCRKLDVSSGTVSRWESSNRNPDFDTLKKIAEILNTSVAYLMGEIDDPTSFFQCGGEVGSQLGQDIIELPKKSISRVASDTKSNVKISDNFIEIPLLSMATVASCGAGNGLYGVVPESTENIYIEADTFTHLDDTRKPFAVSIEGDSMIGAGLEEGVKAVINPAEEVYSGDTALVCYDGSWMIKWVVIRPDKSIELRPANPNYAPTCVEAEYAADPSWFRIIGKVVATVKKGYPKRAF